MYETLLVSLTRLLDYFVYVSSTPGYAMLVLSDFKNQWVYPVINLHLFNKKKTLPGVLLGTYIFTVKLKKSLSHIYILYYVGYRGYSLIVCDNFGNY